MANDAIQPGHLISSILIGPGPGLGGLRAGRRADLGLVAYDGDVSYGRLTKLPEPPGGIDWIHVIPPLFILGLTRFGIPVSTTFLVLTVFTPTNLEGMLVKSLLGYAVAIVTGFLAYRWVVTKLETRFLKTHGEPIPAYWVAIQWLTTAYLWSRLIQDLANIFVYMPRSLSFENPTLVHAWPPRLDLLSPGRRNSAYRHQQDQHPRHPLCALINGSTGPCYLFKEASNLPMSTTLVFLGLLAGWNWG